MVKFNAIIAKKAEIRKEILRKLRSQSSFDRQIKSAEIKKKLFNEGAFKSASVIMFYVPKEYEVNTYDMIAEALKQNKKIAVPLTEMREKRILPSEIKNLDKELTLGPYSIMQPKPEHIRPVPINEIEVVITPGIAFDKTGNRIGHGAGYYDNFLKNLPQKTVVIGLAYDCQLIDEIPTLSWDIPVNKVISA